MKRDSKLGKDALQLAEKNKKTLQFFDLAVRDWNKMGIKSQTKVLDQIKFDVPLLRPEEQDLLRNKLTQAGIVTEKRFNDLVKRGSEILEIPLVEDKKYSLDSINQAKLDELLEKAIPKEGFIRNYVDTYSDITDTPRIFLFWGAMVTVATVLGKNVYIPWEARRLYPNIWCVFLAPSGSRKGTGIDIPTRLLRKIDNELLLPQVASEEGLTKALAEEEEGHEIGFVRWQEFSKILRSWVNRQSWQASQEFWIDLWDNKPLKKKLSGNEFNIPETSISFLSAATPKTFSIFFKPEDLEGGFFGRVYLISCLKKDKYFAIPPSIERKGGEDELITQLKDIKNYFKGETSYIKFEDAFCHWAKNTQQSHKQGFLDSFYSRIETHAMKLAMIYEAATSRQTEISPESFTYAVNALEFLIASAYPLISEEIGLSEREKRISRVEKYIYERTRVPRSDISKNLHIEAFDLDNIERTLIERESISVKEESGKRGPMRKIYFWSSNDKKPFA